jgi:two-component system, NtrC family, response regulator AtoC
MPGQKILVVDDEELILWSLKEELENEGYEVYTATDGAMALKNFADKNPDLVILDYKLPIVDGMEVLRKIKETNPDILVVMITAHGSIDSAVQATKLGAFHYIPKPFDLRELKLIIQKAFQTGNLMDEVKRYREELKKSLEHDKIIGEAPAIVEIRKLINKVAASQANTILIQGESGTGKDLIARALHVESERSAEPFMEINCASLPEQLIESELFGHEKGAYTDAKTTKKGLFEIAKSGTIFLDEISEMSIATQAKLLRAIENRRYKRLGGTEDIAVNARIIAATNRDLKKEVEGGRFREDLFFRLTVIPMTIPPLRERREDIPLIIKFFIEKFNRDFHKNIKGISRKAESILMQYPWPGNVRELKNIIERIIILESEDMILEEHIPKEIQNYSKYSASLGDPDFKLPDRGLSLDDVEKNFIEQALKLTSGNQTRAAAMLGISRHTLRYRMEKYNIL